MPHANATQTQANLNRYNTAGGCCAKSSTWKNKGTSDIWNTTPQNAGLQVFNFNQFYRVDILSH